MRLCRYCWIACLVVLMVFRGEALAAAVPAYSGKMNQAVGGVIQHKVGKWGFAANDPRFGATVNGVGAALTLVAGGVATGAVATVGWPVLLAAAGISALVTGAVSLGQDALYKWLFNPDGTIDTQGGAAASDPGLAPGYCYSYPSTNICVGTKSAVASSLCSVGFTCSGTTQGGTGWTVEYTEQNGAIFQQVWYDNGYTEGKYQIGTVTTIPGTPTGGSSGLTAATVPAAVQNVPDAELAKPVSDVMLAAAVNAAWKSMAAETPNALPWSATDPVTPADVAEWKAANPSAVPNVGDALGPVAAPEGASVPISSPGTAPATGPAPTPGQGTQVDLGPNPNIGAPSLETTPTAQQILEPLLNLFPDLRTFAVPSHSSQCPEGNFSALGATYTIDSQCQLIESNRALIEAAMLLVWGLVSVFIVLRA